MRILVLDDDAMRHTGFSQRWADHERTHVYRYREAVDALVSQPRFDLASLDHDLADLVDNPDTYETSGMYTPAREEYTGTDLAWFIARKLD